MKAEPEAMGLAVVYDIVYFVAVEYWLESYVKEVEDPVPGTVFCTVAVPVY